MHGRDQLTSIDISWPRKRNNVSCKLWIPFRNNCGYGYHRPKRQSSQATAIRPATGDRFCLKWPQRRYFRSLQLGRRFQKCLGRAGEKIVNSRNLMFLEDVNHDIVLSPQKKFWVQGEALKSNFLKVFRPRHFLLFWGASKIKRTAGKKNLE